MSIIGIIPARYGSQRLPAKPLADICGKPMIQHVYEQAKKSNLLTDILVATDDERIENVVKKFGGKAIITPTAIQSGSDRIAYAACSITADIIVNIQGDEPLIAPQMIDQVIQILLDTPDAIVGTIIKKVSSSEELENPNIVKVVIDTKKFALYFSRSPIPYIRDTKDIKGWIQQVEFYKHFGIYSYRATFLQQYSQLKPTVLEQAEKLEQLRILENGFRIKCAITTFDTIAVDTADDLEKVKQKLTNKKYN